MVRRPSSYTRLTLSQKHKLCAKAAAVVAWNPSDLTTWTTREFKTATPVGRSTVRGILKRKHEFDEVPETQLNQKRRFSAVFINEYKDWRGNGTVTGARVLSLAKITDGVREGTCRGWLYKFQQHTGLWFSLRHGESGSLDEAIVTSGRQELKKVVGQYHSRDVYIMDETSFFYRCELRGTLTTGKGEKGKKQSKVSVTVCVGSNADGSDRLPLHFIGKSIVPRPLKDRNVFAELGVTYTRSAKAWMTTTKFCEWLLDINATMKEQERNILLLVDNVSSHNDSSLVLSKVRVHKLPPNTTAALQPMDQGIIKSLKDMYQDKKGDAELKKFINGEKYEPVDLYNAMKWCAGGWKSVSDETIRNCWCHTGFISMMDVRYLLN